MAINIAQQQILADPVSGFLEGRALRMAEKQEASKTKALDNAERRTQERHDTEQKAAAREFEVLDAKKTHATALQILSTPNAKRTIETQYSDWLGKAVEGGLDWGGISEEGIRDYLQGLASRTAGEAGIAPAKTTPLSKEGKVKADVKAGILTEDEGKAALAGKQSNPNSWDEFVLSQKDPAFAKFLKERKGKGLSITTPDGTVIEMGGEGGGVGPGELSKPTINNLQEAIVNNSNRLDRINQMLSSYKPEFLQAKGLIKAGSAELQEFIGMDLSEDQRKFLAGYSEFKASASQEFSATLKELSGVAASEAEVERVIKGVPSDRDRSPTVFDAKARATTKFITRAIMRANWALKNGIGVKSVDDLAKVMPIEGIDAVYETRANEIWQELGGTPETKAQAIKQANEEFGLAR